MIYEYIITAFKVIVGMVTNNLLTYCAIGGFAFLFAWVLLSLLFSFQTRFANNARRLNSYVKKHGMWNTAYKGFMKHIKRMPAEFVRGYKTYEANLNSLPSNFIKRFDSLDIELSGGVFNQNKSIIKTYINFVFTSLLLFSVAAVAGEQTLTGYIVAEAAVIPLCFVLVSKITYYVYTAIRQHQYKIAVDEFYDLVETLDSCAKNYDNKIKNETQTLNQTERTSDLEIPQANETQNYNEENNVTSGTVEKVDFSEIKKLKEEVASSVANNNSYVESVSELESENPVQDNDNVYQENDGTEEIKNDTQIKGFSNLNFNTSSDEENEKSSYSSEELIDSIFENEEQEDEPQKDDADLNSQETAIAEDNNQTETNEETKSTSEFFEGMKMETEVPLISSLEELFPDYSKEDVVGIQMYNDDNEERQETEEYQIEDYQNNNQTSVEGVQQEKVYVENQPIEEEVETEDNQKTEKEIVNNIDEEQDEVIEDIDEEQDETVEDDVDEETIETVEDDIEQETAEEQEIGTQLETEDDEIDDAMEETPEETEVSEQDIKAELEEQIRKLTLKLQSLEPTIEEPKIVETKKEKPKKEEKAVDVKNLDARLNMFESKLEELKGKFAEPKTKVPESKSKVSVAKLKSKETATLNKKETKEKAKKQTEKEVKDYFKPNFSTLFEEGEMEQKRGRGRPRKEPVQTGEFVIKNDKEFEDALVRAEKLMRKNEEPLSASQTKRIEKQLKELVDAMSKYKEGK